MTDIDPSVEVRYHPVYPSESNFVRGINYIPEENLMEVRLKDGDHGEKPYYYPGVPEYRYEQFTEADSYGKYYSQYVKANDGNTRDYGFTGDPDLREDLENALESTTQGIVNRVQSNDPVLYDEHRALFESVSRRQADTSVLDVKDNSDILKLAYDFRQLIVREALEVIRTEHPETPEWVQECEQISEEGASASTSYMTLTQI